MLTTIMNELHQDHIHLTKVLNIMDQQVALITSGHTPDLFLLADIAHYIQNYPDLIHHPKEDIIFNVLKQKTSEGAEMVAQLQDDHEKLPHETTELYNMLKSVAGSVLLLSRDELKSTIEHFIDLERKHMALEEQFVFPLIKEKLEDADLMGIDRSGSAEIDPLFGRLASCYENLYQSIKSRGD